LQLVLERHEVRRPGNSRERPGRRASWNHKVPLLSVAQLVAQLAEGFALSRDADSTT